MPKDFYGLFHFFSTFHCLLKVKLSKTSLNSEQKSTKKLKKYFNDASGLLCIISLFSTVSRPFSSPPFCFSTNRIPRFCAKRARSILLEICDAQKSGENPIYLIATFASESVSRLVRHTLVLLGFAWLALARRLSGPGRDLPIAPESWWRYVYQRQTPSNYYIANYTYYRYYIWLVIFCHRYYSIDNHKSITSIVIYITVSI